MFKVPRRLAELKQTKGVEGWRDRESRGEAEETVPTDNLNCKSKRAPGWQVVEDHWDPQGTDGAGEWREGEGAVQLRPAPYRLKGKKWRWWRAGQLGSRRQWLRCSKDGNGTSVRKMSTRTGRLIDRRPEREETRMLHGLLAEIPGGGGGDDQIVSDML